MYIYIQYIHNIQPTIWGLFIQSIYTDFGDGLYIGFTKPTSIEW